MKNENNQSLTIGYRSSVPLNMDDVVYIVETDDNGHKTFFQKCRVCGGERKLTINGVTFNCPCCRNEEQALTVHKFVVHRYRIYKIEATKSTDTWKPSEYQSVRFGVYRKTDRGYWHSTTRDLSYSHLNPVEPSASGSPVFTNYALAVETANAFNEQERKKLAEYNEQHGTDYEMPDFADIVNDRKSN